MYGLTGLTGIAGYQVQIDAEAQANPEERHGNIADPRHGELDRTTPYAWEANSVQAGVGHGPYGPENQLLGDEWYFIQPAGDQSQDPYMDRTPARRAAPWPKGIASGTVPGETPDQIADQLAQSYAIHGIRANAGMKSVYNQAGDIQQDEWVLLDEVNSGSSDLRPLDKQALSSNYQWGTRDRIQSMARQNEYGFDSKHMLRRYATGPIPGNTLWMKPGGRPLAKSLPGPARPAIGVDSPFADDDLGTNFSIDGAILQTVPSEYVPPPQPNLAIGPPRSAESYGDSVVEWY